MSEQQERGRYYGRKKFQKVRELCSLITVKICLYVLNFCM